MHIILYGDESGTITLSNAPQFKYFYIGMISTHEKNKVKRVFRKAKLDYIKQNNVKLNIKDEIKGSEMSEGMKGYVLRQLIDRTDIAFYFIVVDNHFLRRVLREKPHVTYNYLIGILIKHHFKYDYEQLNLVLDNRNKSVDNLKDLEHYLKTELIVNTDIKCVNVQYVDSKNCDLVQVADVFNNLLYRYGNGQQLQHQGKGEKNFNKNKEIMTMLLPRIRCAIRFPESKCEFTLYEDNSLTNV
ncbi:DUF3800 domain-containing protein [Macrococcus capreoli]